MNCDQIRERLPWFLNGTLPPEERRQVAEHLDTCAGCREEHAKTRLAWQIFEQHLSPAALVALAWEDDRQPAGAAPAAGAAPDLELARRHLDTCPACAAELELARLSRHLEEDPRIIPYSAPAAAAPPRRRQSRPWRAAALAACLAAALVAPLWLRGLQPRSPDVNIAHYDLDPASQTRGGPAAEPLKIPAGARAELSLKATGEECGAVPHRIRILEASTRRIQWQNDHLLCDREGYYSLTLHAGYLHPGRYIIEVSPLGGSGPTESYTIAVGR